ncbi:MAG: alpha/beta fold hydrolase, partial [Stellaceae bacterium]
MALAERGYRVATFDLLGQGNSDKPSLFIGLDDQVAVLRDLVDELGDHPVFVAGISFGAVIALRYAIAHSDRIAGLVPMSAFAELTPQLLMLGKALRTGLILGGTTYLQDLLFPMNLSDEYITERFDKLE